MTQAEEKLVKDGIDKVVNTSIQGDEQLEELFREHFPAN